MKQSTQTKVEELRLVAKELIKELNLDRVKFPYIHELFDIINQYEGTTISGLYTTVSLLMDIFPKSECDFIRMKTERFINRMSVYLDEIDVYHRLD